MLFHVTMPCVTRIVEISVWLLALSYDGKFSELRNLHISRGLGWFWKSCQKLKVNQGCTLYIGVHYMCMYRETWFERPLPWETTCLERPHIPFRRFHITIHLSCHQRHLSWQTKFLWPMGRFFKTGSAVHSKYGIQCTCITIVSVINRQYWQF